MKLAYLVVEVGVTLLNIGLFSLAAVRLFKERNNELDNQAEKIEKRINNYADHIDTALQNANTNLNFNKTLQWNYIYYVVVLFGAIFALATKYPDDLVIQILLSIASNLIFHVGLFLTMEIIHQIRKERLSIIRIQLLLTSDKEELEELNKRKREAMRYLYSPYITLTLIITVVIGYATSLFIIIRNTI